MGSYGPKSLPNLHPLPVYHLKAPRGWMNDPCAPGFDATTGIYHLFYQWNPKSCDWGNIAWGHFTSRDGIHWKHNGDTPVLSPGLGYDKDGIFTGCLYTTGLRGEKNQLTIAYSSVCSLPIHWTLEHTRNCTGIALAVSRDQGRSWQKYAGNPVLVGEPDDVVVTGFRDPYLDKWPAMDKLRGGKSLYGVLSGGIVGKGPNAFLYAVSPTDLTRWEYLGPLISLPSGFSAPGRWGCNFGLNWECVNFMTLRNGSKSQEVLLLGSEGGLKPGRQERDKDAHGVWSLWMAGSWKRSDSGLLMGYDVGGFLDHGCLYAANSYEHPLTGTRIVWGWLKEDDLPLPRREAKGWAGYLSLPREVFWESLDNVTRSWNSPLEEIKSMLTIEETSRGTRTVQTLGIRPLQGLELLRRGPPRAWHGKSGQGNGVVVASTSSAHWELEAIIKVRPGQQRVGFHLRHTEDMAHRTSVYFSLEHESITVDRSRSNFEDDIKKDDVVGPFILFVFDEAGREVTEKLHLRIFSDGDVLEIFANDRFALSTVIYSDADKCRWITAFVEGECHETDTFEQVNLWDIRAEC